VISQLQTISYTIMVPFMAGTSISLVVRCMHVLTKFCFFNRQVGVFPSRKRKHLINHDRFCCKVQ